MSCNFVDVSGSPPGAFTCKRCIVCNNTAHMPVELAGDQWPALLAHIQQNCPHDAIAKLDEAIQTAELNIGPGSFLKKYLSRIGITSTPNCSCNAKAKHMDTMGIEWCEQNLDTIVGWLKDEAEKRRLPFVPWPARLLVKKAIAAAKKAAAKTRD
jgi:hypothetical protein